MNRQWSQRLCQQALVSIFLIVLVSCQHHNRLHISITENDLLRYSDKAYVRIYQTVFSAAEGASKTTFPNGITYKDIWQDADGRIIIAPGDSLDNPTWVGIADPRNQLKFISNYKTQVNPADNPLVRSFLVDYETVRNVLNPRRIVTEDPKFKGLGLSLNVDKHAANQFGLNHFDTDEFRKNALPGSLITYTSKSVDQKKYEHWGTIRPVEELYDYLGLPSDDIPGAYSDTHAKERTKGSEMQIDNYLQELETLQQKSKGGANVESVIQDKLKEFNNKYIYEKISTGDLPIEGIDISFEKQKLLKKLKTQITYFEKELSKMYKHANNVLYAEVENKVNEYNEKFRSNVPEQLSPPELPIMKKDAVAVQKQLLSEITKLNELKGRFDAGENVKVELDQRLRKYNDYMTADGRTLTRDDLKNIKAYKEEALARRQISERFYKADLNPTLKNLDEFEWKQIPKIETDPMFTDSKDINMHELLRRGEKFRKQFLGAKKFLAYAESYSNEFNSILKNDRSKDLNRVRNLRNAESLLRNSNDPQFLIRTKYGFLYGSGDFSNDQITRIFNDIGKSVAVLIPNDETRVAVVGKLKTFTDKVTKGLKKVTYHSEIIVQLGDSTEVGEASKYLFNRYTKEYKNVKHLIFNDDGLYSTVVSGMAVEVDSNTRIFVIGHGKTSGSHLSIGGKDPVILAKDLSKVILTKSSDEKVKVGKLSLIACNVDANEGFEIGSRFGQNLVEALNSNNIQSVVTVRVGVLQVTQDGYKLYGKLSNHHFRNKPPIIVKLTTKNGRMVPEYGIINTNTETVQWNAKVPEHVENAKLYILSETFGSFDIADSVEKTRLKSLKVVDEHIKKSGGLHFQNKDIIIDTSKESQPTSGIYLEIETSKDHVLPLVDQTGIESVLMEVDASVWVEKLSVATGDAVKALPDSGDWIPLIDTAEINQEGKNKVTVLNLDTRETQIIEVKNDVFLQFKKRSKMHAMSVRNLPTITKATLGMSGTGGLFGFAGFIMSAIQLAQAKKCEKNITCPSTEVGRKLAKSLEINAYLGFAMSTYGLISDSVQIAELAVGFSLSKHAVKGIATMTKATSNFLQFSKVFGGVGMGVGAAGSVVSLGFSAYQLAHAEQKAQKIQFGIQVGIDSVNVIVSGVAVGATITAVVTSSATASSIASTAGPVGLVVAVYGIFISAITGLVFEFINTRKNAQQVGDYFYILDNVYRQGGYNFDSSSNIFKILDHAIMTSVDLENGVIHLDSQYIYRTRHGKTGSGKNNYFFWYKDFPKMIKDKYQAINIRNGIGYDGRQIFYSARRVHTLILPAIPKSYISYSYSRLPFCTAMHDKGFDIIRRLERDYRFDYDFYIFPGEQIVSSIEHEYVDSDITITLTSNVKTIVVPNISDKKYYALHNKYTFKIITKSGQHTLILEDYYTFLLQRMSSTPCSWYLSYDNVDFNKVSFSVSRGWITIDHVKIHVNMLDDKLYVFDDHGGILLLDPRKKTKTLTSIVQGHGTSSTALKNYLKTMNKDWLSKQQYVVIAKFIYNGESMGRAFYDVDSEDFLFTNLQGVRVSNKFKDNVQMLAVFHDGVYFMSNENTDTVIWRVHVKTKKVVASYVLYCGNSEFQISKLSTQGDSTYLIQNVYDVSLVYMISANEIKLVFIDGLKEDIYKLADACFQSLHNLLPQRMSQTLSFPGKCIYASTIPILPIKQTLSNGTTNNFWLYMNDSQIPPDDKSDIFCPPSKPPVATGIITPLIEKECKDLTLREVQRLDTGEEVYYFYCEGDKHKLYYQVGNNASVEAIFPGEIERFEDFGAIKLIRSKTGGLYKFTGTSQFTLAALSFNSFALQNNWKEAFNAITKQAMVESFIPVMNMKSIQRKDLTAWYDTVTDRLIIVSPRIDAQDIVYLGPSPSEVLVWLYNPHRRHVILQKILDDEEISKKIVRRNNEAYWNDELSPEAKIVVSDANSVQYIQGNVFVVTKEGVMLSIDYLQKTTFLGVNTTWIVNNNESLALELEILCTQYQSGSPITLGKQSVNNITDTVHNWYHCAMKCQVALTTNKNIQPVYLGMTQAKKMLFFLVGVDIIQIVVTSNKDVYSESIPVTKVKNAMVRGTSLLLQTMDFLQLNFVPKLDNVRSLVVVTAYASKIILKADDWLHYGTIFISSIGTAGPQLLHVNINPPFHCSFLFEEVEKDTVIRDPISERVIVLEDFTVNFEKSDENYVPIGNEAVLRVQICDKKPVILVTNRERFDPMVSYLTGKDPDDSEDIFEFKLVYIISTLVVFVIFIVLIILFVKYRRNRSQRHNSIPGGHATSGKHRIQLSQIKEGNETSL